MRGSWAGAMGNMQFMPSTFMKWGVDRDGDGRIDLWTSLPDAFASAANFLRGIGLKPGCRRRRSVPAAGLPARPGRHDDREAGARLGGDGREEGGQRGAAQLRRALVDHPAGGLARARLHPLSQLQGGDELEPLDALCAVGRHPGAADRGRPAGHAGRAGRRRAAVARHRHRHAEPPRQASPSTPTRSTAFWAPRPARRCGCTRSRSACRPTAIRRRSSCAACNRRVELGARASGRSCSSGPRASGSLMTLRSGQWPALPFKPIAAAVPRRR